MPVTTICGGYDTDNATVLLFCASSSLGGRGISEDRILAIIGVGLIGGSIGLAAKSKGLFAEVRGTTRRRQTLDAALAAGAIDTPCLSPAEAARGADMVVVATSVATIPRFVLECAAAARENALITDVGSVKGVIDAAVRPNMPSGRIFIGSHPMAGSEKTSVLHARPDLLAGATCIITPAEGQDAHADALSAFWQDLSMNVFRMTPAEHDWVVAAVSHMPHLTAAAIMAAIPDAALPFGASGLRDTTRVAEGDACLWREIVLANHKEIIDAIGRLEIEIDTLKGLVLRGDTSGLEDYLRTASQRRKKRFDGGLS